MTAADRQLDLVRSWFERELNEEEVARAQQMIAAGDKPPYIARCLMMWAAAERKEA